MSKKLQFSPGQVFGEWRIVSSETIVRGRKSYVQAICSCGKTDWVHASNIARGKTKSCGCQRKYSHTLYKTRHGMTDSSEYVIWCSMKKRCENKNCHAYARYGGRGITVCERWQVFENFYNDMGPRPDGMSIERINNDLGYSPDNCVWANRTRQIRNRSNTMNVTVDGETAPLIVFCKRYGIRYKTAWYRVNRGMSPEAAVKTPLMRPRRDSSASIH